MRSVDLAVFADSVAAEFASVSARLERTRRRLRQAELEREARAALPATVVARLEAMSLLGPPPEPALERELARARADLAALRTLQTWIEAELAARRAGCDGAATLSRPLER